MIFIVLHLTGPAFSVADWTTWLYRRRQRTAVLLLLLLATH